MGKVKEKRDIYSAAVIASGCLWGVMGFFRRGMDAMGLDTPGVVMVRFGFAALLFILTAAIGDPAALRLRLGDLWCFLGSGICSLLFFTLCYFQAMTIMSLSTAAILLYTAPCFVIIMSALFFRERIDGRKLLAMLMAFAGCCLVSGVVGSDARVSLVGLLYGLGSGFGYALYSIFVKLAMKRGYKSTTINLYSCLFAAAGAGIVGGFSAPAAIVFASGENFIFCLVGAAVTCYLPYLLYTFGLSGTEAGKASILASLEPVVATLMGFFVFGETVSTAGALGIALVLAAIVLLEIKGKGGR